ncbi:hypothetical protein [Winogradskyella tangerina]|uniref:hypothetical protein n=1 Tax=Winogradskyella tangerina TaxID=2023240 RepID=UPI000DBE52EA|nr:hypothetical protein [Winogradskyella tangerina]
MKLRAGALQLVTFVVVVIALLLSSFILLMHLHKQFRIKTNHTIEMVNLVNYGIDSFLYSEMTLNDTIAIDSPNKDFKSISIYGSYWGGFERIYVEAKRKTTKLSKVALVGQLKDTNTPALYLQDNNKPLVLVGQTRITGKSHLPYRGVKSGNIAGQSFSGGKYINGKSLLSNNLPHLSTEFLGYLEDISRSKYAGSTMEYKHIRGQKILKNSFEDSIQVIYDTSEILLADITVLGHLIIQSETKITVDSTAELQDILLIAPIIEIGTEVSGSFQAIATEQIDVKKGVTLAYPSALILQKDYEKNKIGESSGIAIADGSVVSGQILILGETQVDNYDAQLKISANAIVEGTIYCQQNLELRGTVYGSVYTNNFIIKEAGSTYQNHLFNALIDVTVLHEKFVGLGFENSPKGIAKWLY